MSKICIIGTEGAGKTVFISTFATRFQEVRSGLPWMTYRNRETARYVAQNWSILTDQQDWPPSTPTGTLPSLEWGLHTPDGIEHTLNVQDVPGQDIRAIFDSNPDELNEKQKELLYHIQQSDILLFLINLRDVIRATTEVERTNFEIPIVMALKNILERNARAALLLSQHDQLQAYLDEIGVSHDDPLGAIQRCLPTVYGIVHKAGTRLKTFFVASVAETVPFIDKQGNVSSRPKAQFQSEGLFDLMAWLLISLEEIQHYKIQAEREETIKEQSALAKKVTTAKKKRSWWTGITLVGLFLLSWFIGTGIADSNTPTHRDILVNKRGYRPIPQEYWRHEIKRGDVGIPDDIILYNTSKYYFERLYIDVSFRGKRFRREYMDNLLPGHSVLWEKTYNFSWDEKDARIYAYCIMDYTETESRPLPPEERARIQASNQIIVIPSAFIIASFGALIAFKLPRWFKNVRSPLPSSSRQ